MIKLSKLNEQFWFNFDNLNITLSGIYKSNKVIFTISIISVIGYVTVLFPCFIVWFVLDNCSALCLLVWFNGCVLSGRDERAFEESADSNVCPYQEQFWVTARMDVWLWLMSRLCACRRYRACVPMCLSLKRINWRLKERPGRSQIVKESGATRELF